jgi:PAS domain S-box-containing protein
MVKKSNFDRVSLDIVRRVLEEQTKREGQGTKGQRLKRSKQLSSVNNGANGKGGKTVTYMSDGELKYQESQTPVRKRMETPMSELQAYLRALDQKCDILSHLPMAAYVVQADGVVIWYNARAVELWGREPAIGDTDERFCGAHTLFHADGSHMAHCDTPVALALNTGASVHEEEVIIGRPDGSRVHVSVHIDPIRNPKNGRIIGVVNYFNDLTERKRQQSEREHLLREAETRSAELQEARQELETKVEQRTVALRHLSSRLMSAQEEQSRRIARELHDSLGQYLSALGMSLAQLEMAAGSKSPEILSECRQLLDQCVNETRTLSHLLHPPLLDEIGFAPVAKSYVEEFARRSGIEIDISLDLPHRLPADAEILLFRVLQESLTNIHRHSGSSRAKIRAGIDEGTVSLEIRDYGHGISEEVLERFRTSGNGVGLGLAGVRERLREVDGNLELSSTSDGTILRVSLLVTSAREPYRRFAAGLH